MGSKSFHFASIRFYTFEQRTEKMIQITASMMSRCYVAALYAILLFWWQQYEGSARQDKIFDFFFGHIHFLKAASIRVPQTKGIDCTNAQQPYDNIHD